MKLFKFKKIIEGLSKFEKDYYIILGYTKDNNSYFNIKLVINGSKIRRMFQFRFPIYAKFPFIKQYKTPYIR